MLLQGKTAVITGCSRGIGKSTLEVFARNGCSVWACCRKPSEEFEAFILNLQNEYKVSIYPLYFDLADSEQVKKAAKEIFSSKQKIDILVNNAGVTPTNSLFLMTPLDSMKEIFNINFFSSMQLIQYIGRLMSKNRSGSIVNVASIAGLDGGPGQLEYTASKAALIGATKKLADEFADYQIRVNAVAPGVVETDMIGRMSEELLQESVSNNHMKRLGKAEEIANAILFLASDQSSFITGQILRVDGGC
ncbi:SDR family NAD(P)-dependent oxidoreductase [Saccharibacillus deserti]|uniref:SDR family NAD(P)-dependent oxidoreductase n=1 Tax=Saccharibacillus deserti TaxID=1634444 RepID=UPI00155297A4|nr:SDR family NAD(P)-dependent oxidoreductase [Saccharibacillus deserti]